MSALQNPDRRLRYESTTYGYIIYVYAIGSNGVSSYHRYACFSTYGTGESVYVDFAEQVLTPMKKKQRSAG